MKALQDQLRMISKVLLSLSKNVDKFAKQMDKLPSSRQSHDNSGIHLAGNPGPLANTLRQTTLVDLVYDAIRRSRKGASIQVLREKTGLSPRQLSNALYKLSKKEKIEAKQRGVYYVKNKR